MNDYETKRKEIEQLNVQRRIAQAKDDVASTSSVVYGDPTKPAATPGTSITPPGGLAQVNFKSAEPFMPLFRKYFREEDIPKVIWTTHWESGFNPNAVNPSSGATGLLQNLTKEGGNPDRLTQAELKDPDTNLRESAKLLYGPGGKDAPQGKAWSHWGEGALYQGKPFGALGFHPYFDDPKVKLPANPLPSDLNDVIKTNAEAMTNIIANESAIKDEISTYRSSATFDKVKEEALNRAQAEYSAAPRNLREQAYGITNPKPPSDIYQKYLDEATARYQADGDALNKKLSEVADAVQNTRQFDFFLTQLPTLLSDNKTNIKSYNDLVAFVSPIYKQATGEDFKPFSEYQKGYLGKYVENLSPFLNHTDTTNPITTKQVAEFLAAANTGLVSSKRVSIGGLTNDQIRSALTTIGGAKQSLPPGITEEMLRNYFSSNNLLTDAQRKEVDKLSGTAADIVKKWAEEDNRIKAYKAGTQNPLDLPLLKNRVMSLPQIGLELLNEFNKNVTRPAAAFGTIGLDTLIKSSGIDPFGLRFKARDFINNDLGLGKDVSVSLPIIGNTGNLNPLAIEGGSADELKADIRRRRDAGQNTWTAGGDAFENWDANGFLKFGLETMFDPTTYLGFGIYTDLTRGIPILGHTVEAVEKGFGLAFNNPLVTHAALSGGAAAFTYEKTGDLRTSLLVGAGVGLTTTGIPVLRGLDLFTPRQLLGRSFNNSVSTLNEALLSFTNRATIEGVTADEIRGMITHAQEVYNTSPKLAHFTPEGRAIKKLLQDITPWADQTELATWAARAGRVNEPTTIVIDRTTVGDTGVPSLAKADTRNLKSSQILGKWDSGDVLQVNNILDRMLNSTERGVLNSEQAADLIAPILFDGAITDATRTELKTIIEERIQGTFNTLSKLAEGTDGNAVYIKLMDAAKNGIAARFDHPNWNQGLFQGFVNGLMRPINSVERNKVWTTMAQIQNFYARSQLWFPTFKPMNALETWFRAGIGGSGFALPTSADTIYAAQNRYGWHRLYPQAIKEGGVRRLDAALIDREGKSVAPKLLSITREKEKVFTMGDWVKDIVNPFNKKSPMLDLEDRIRAAYYPRALEQKFAEVNPEGYAFLKSLRDDGVETLTRNGYNTKDAHDIITDLWDNSLRPNGVELIRDNIMDVTQLERQTVLRNVSEKLEEAQFIDRPIKDYIMTQIERGRIGTISDVINEARGQLYDYYLVRGELGQDYVREMTTKVLNTIDTIDTPESMSGLIRTLNDVHGVVNSSADELRQIAARRANTVLGETGKNEFWEWANKSFSDYVNVASEELRTMRNVIGTRLNEFYDPDTARTITTMLSNMENRVTSMQNTRSQLDTIISDFSAAHGGRRPQGAEWDSINSDRDAIWKKHLSANREATEYHNTLAEILHPSQGVLIPVDTGNLTVAHIGKLFTASGDQIGSSLVQLDSMMSREDFIGTVYGTARGKATIAGQNVDAIGWSRDDIGRVYDQLRIRAESNPGEGTALIQAQKELENTEKEIKVINMTTTKNQGDVDILTQVHNDWANKLEDFTSTTYQVSSLKPDLINPENIAGLRIKSRYNFETIRNNDRDAFYKVNGTTLFVNRDSGFLDEVQSYEISISRDNAVRGKYSWAKRYEGRAQGSDLESLVESGQVIDDLQRNNPDAVFWAYPSDARRARIYKRAGFVEGTGDYHGLLVLDKLKLPRPAPVATPGTGSYTRRTYDVTWDEKVDKAFELANLHFNRVFTDYENANIFDAVMKTIDPFWTYQSQRWPWLASAAISHPGILTTGARYQDYTENGYIHIPGADLAFNPFRGTIFMGGMGGLVREFPALKEKGPIGELSHAMETIGKYGYYGGFWATLPLLFTNGFDLPPLGQAAMDIGSHIPGVDQFVAAAQEHVFHNKYRDYYITNVISDEAQKRGLDPELFNGNKVRIAIESGTATDEQKQIWNEARRTVARYDLLFAATSMFKLDHETKKAANREYAKALESYSGVDQQTQDAITDRLGSSGMRLTDIIPIDPVEQRRMQELNKAKYWSGLSNSIMPSQIKDMRDRIDRYWTEVENRQTEGREKGFTDSRGTVYESLNSLDQQFRSGKLSAKDFLKKQSDTRAQIASEIEGLKKTKEFEKVPISLEERAKYYEDNGIPVPVDHPAKELINTYHALSPKPDPVTGEPDWDTYFASVDALVNTLPDDKRGYFLDYLHREWTPTQLLYWESNNKYLRPYKNVREGVLQAINPEQRAFFDQYQHVNEATIKNLPEEQQKLLRDINAALGRADDRFRQLAPTTDAWLFYWGKATTLKSEAARAIYNQIVKAHPGPSPYLTPIEEKRNLLPSLP